MSWSVAAGCIRSASASAVDRSCALFFVAMDAGGDRTCFCGEPSGLRLYCPRCEGLLGRKRKGQKPDMAARRDALHAQWSEDRRAFVCAYTGISLTHMGGATNAEWEHRIPRVESSVVLVAAVVNRMKADLTEEQWDAMIAALYALRIKHKRFKKALRIKHKRFKKSALPDNWQTKASSWLEDD